MTIMHGSVTREKCKPAIMGIRRQKCHCRDAEGDRRPDTGEQVACQFHGLRVKFRDFESGHCGRAASTFVLGTQTE